MLYLSVLGFVSLYIVLAGMKNMIGSLQGLRSFPYSDQTQNSPKLFQLYKQWQMRSTPNTVSTQENLDFKSSGVTFTQIRIAYRDPWHAG